MYRPPVKSREPVVTTGSLVKRSDLNRSTKTDDSSSPRRDVKRPASALEAIPKMKHHNKRKIATISVPEEILRDIQFNMIDVKLFQRNILDKSDLILLKSYSSNDEVIEILFALMQNKSADHHANFLDIIEEDYKWLRDKCEILLQKMQLAFFKNNIKITCSSEENNSSVPSIMMHLINSNEISDENPESISECYSNQENYLSSRPTGNKSSVDSVALTEKQAIKKEVGQVITSEMISIVRRNYHVVSRWTTLAHVLGMTSVVYIIRMRMQANGEDMDASIIHLLNEWKGRNTKNATLRNLLAALREENFNEVADELEAKFP